MGNLSLNQFHHTSFQCVWYSCIHLRKLHEIVKPSQLAPNHASNCGELAKPAGIHLLHFRHRADNLPTECPAMNSQKLIPKFCTCLRWWYLSHINRCRILANNTMTITITIPNYWTQIMVENTLQYFSLGMASPGVQDLPLVLLCYRKQRMISSNHLKKYCAYLCLS